MLYSFCNQTNCADGATPVAGLIDVNATLYGTTANGGVKTCSNGCGTLFSLDPATGTETVLYSFCSQTNCADGATPAAGLIDVDGMLYGTTQEGGAAGLGKSLGTVFALDPTNDAETVLHSFGSGSDGAYPTASLIELNDALYGTTQSGGAHQGGTVFALDPTNGSETVLYSFCAQRLKKKCLDGVDPDAELIDLNGTLYGTTQDGGKRCRKYGCGTVFSLDPTTRTETVVYGFISDPDGAVPYAGLIDLNGILYGTTVYGGSKGYGTVFSLKPR